MSTNEVQKQPHQREEAQANRFLTFSIGNESYGVGIEYVSEIIGMKPIFEVPGLPESIRGVINLRSKIIPIMDVQQELKKSLCAYHDRTCIIILTVQDLLVGLIIDSVSDVVSIPVEQIVDPPQFIHGDMDYIKGIGRIGNDLKLILDCHKMLKCS